MTIYLATNSDGKHTEGIGAMVQYQMACYAAAKMYNLNYAFFGFKNLTHYQYFDITQQKFCDDINLFFSLPNQFDRSEDYDVMHFDRVDNSLLDYVKNHNMEDNIICFISPSGLMRFLENNIKQIEENGWFQDLKKSLQIPIIQKTSGILEVSIHIRKLTQTDCDPNPIRDLYDSSKKQRLVKLIEKIFNITKCNIHIHSQGKEILEIKNLLQNQDHIFFHLDEYPIKTLSDLINSDILIAANSSLSYISHLYGNQITLIRDNFYHKTYENTIKLDYNFNFDQAKLILLLGKKISDNTNYSMLNKQ
jgi:hypothetical protein